MPQPRLLELQMHPRHQGRGAIHSSVPSTTAARRGLNMPGYASNGLLPVDGRSQLHQDSSAIGLATEPLDLTLVGRVGGAQNTFLAARHPVEDSGAHSGP